ncbi:MAG TPA: hydroxymethylbilane synthase [Ktedonobacteraceae bacterium]|jgi:hydroxymethylbilane synthase|nr:hydroxymethylbilane synthase [Ktedonobacteraceae bacterium]
MTQTNWVSAQLHRLWPDLDIEIQQIRTTGDRNTSTPLAQIGGDGVFVTEIEHALQAQRVDLAVHSLKDLPTAQPAGLRVVVTGPREDVRDVLVTNDVFSSDEQAQEALRRVGTVSLRRIAQLRVLLPGADILPLRGNVDTRVRKLEAGEYDGILVAAAGLHRLGLQERLAGRLRYFPAETLLPAPGQGALGLECRDEEEMLALLAPLRDDDVQAATSAERMFMRHLGAGCYLPVAAYGTLKDEQLQLDGLVSSLDGTRRIRVQQQIRWQGQMRSIELAEQLGVSLAELALAEGAGEIIRELSVIREQEHV